MSRMERLRIVLTPALRSSCSARLMLKRRMCSGGGADVSRGKEAGGDSGSFSQNKIWKPTLFTLGGAAVGLYLYNNAATKEKKARRGREEATECHNREMEHHKLEHDIYDQIQKLQMTQCKALIELLLAKIKLLVLEVKVASLERKVNELAAAARKANAVADKN